jgi:hypothetical protein
MIRIDRILLALTLGAGMLILPLAMLAAGSLPAQNRPDVSDRQRIYDRDRRDYHEWNNTEDRAYRRYWQGRHRAYREFSRLNAREAKSLLELAPQPPRSR